MIICQCTFLKRVLIKGIKIGVSNLIMSSYEKSVVHDSVVVTYLLSRF